MTRENQKNQLAAQKPTISRALNDALNIRWAGKFDGMIVHGGKPPKTQALHDEAEALLARFEANGRAPLSEGQRKAELDDLYDILGMVVANPPSADARDIWVFAATLATADYPADAWGEGFKKLVIKSCKFFPTPAEICEFLEKRTQEIRNKRAKLQLFIREPIPTPDPPRKPPTEEEKRYVSEMVRNLFPTQRKENRHA